MFPIKTLTVRAPEFYEGDKCWYLERMLPHLHSVLNPLENGFSMTRILVVRDKILERSISLKPIDQLLG